MWVVAGLVALLAIAVPSALAIHDFTDVPDASPFHGDIAAVKGAGITAGKTCDPPGVPPTYCPLENITREAMAAFVHRGLGRAAQSNAVLDGTLEFSPDFPTDVIVGQVDITVGGVGAGVTQFVEINAQVTLGDNSTDAATTAPPYTVFYYLAEGDQNVPGNRTVILAQRIRDADASNDTTAISWVRAAAPGPHTYKLHAWSSPPGGVAVVNGLALTATTHAFGSTGASTLGTASTPNQPRPRP